MACSPIFGTHGIRASQVLHDHLLLTSRIMSSMDVKMVRSFFMGYGYLTKHFRYQKWRMYIIENPPQTIRLTKVSIPAFFGYLKPFGDSCTCTRRCLKKKTHHDGTSQVGRFDDYVRISLDQPLGDVKISYITKKTTNGLVQQHNFTQVERISKMMDLHWNSWRYLLKVDWKLKTPKVVTGMLQSNRYCRCHQRLIDVSSHSLGLANCSFWRNPGTQNSFIGSQGHVEMCFCSYSPGGIC